MAGSNSTQKQTGFYNLKAKVSESENPYFGKAEKINGAWTIPDDKRFNTMTGMLNKAEIKEKEYQGAKFNVFCITMEDDNETLILEMTHNSLAYSIINTLASDLNKLDTYTIKVYKVQSKTDKQYWNGGCEIRVGKNPDKLKWLVNPAETPKKVPVMVGDKPLMKMGKKVLDDTAQREYWEKFFREKIIAVLGSGTPAASPKTTTEPADEPGDNEEVPF